MERRTRRSSEQEPADALRDKSNVIGGWLPSLTLSFGLAVVSQIVFYIATIMKTQITLVLLATGLATMVGCASPDKGAAYGHEQQFRQQLMESDLVKRYGFHIQDLRFSEDYRKALVVRGLPDSKTGQPAEILLVSDAFGRYHLGASVKVDLQKFAGLKSPPAFLPDFRQQLEESIPVKQYGYTIKKLVFSKDYKKALVVFTHPTQREAAGNDQRPDMEFVLALDDFGRYQGMTMQPFYTPGTANTPGIYVTVTIRKN